MSTAITASRTAALVAGFDRTPAYAGLADALVVAIGDGRIPLGARLPSERELTDVLGVSRTTVTRAYARLCELGYAAARRGAGTFAQVPGGRSRAHDRALMPRVDGADMVDLNCAAASAPPGLATAYAQAVAELPAYFGGHGYYPAGLPGLQEAIAASFEARGLPTSPDQIMVTPGALTAAAVVAQAFGGRGARVLVESPVYPNAVDAIRHAGARLVASPVDPGGWDLDAVAATLRQTRPGLAYLIPDFQNPTGHVMTAEQRERLAASLAQAGTVAVVDEAHQALELDGGAMPPPFATFAPGTITVGSASKSFWGGLRLGWIRAPRERMEQLTAARVRLDLGAPVLEQLVLARLLSDPEPVLAAHRARLREQRDSLVAALRAELPDWDFHLPSGGLALWCRLPQGSATRIAAEAERRGTVVAPGPVFAVGGGLDSFVRVPWTRPPDELRRAVGALAGAVDAVGAASRPPARAGRVMVA